MKSEVFDGKGQRLASTAQAAFGWDPYEVWRTRVRTAPEAMLLPSSSVVGDSRQVSILVLSRIAVSSESSEQLQRLPAVISGCGSKSARVRNGSERGTPWSDLPVSWARLVVNLDAAAETSVPSRDAPPALGHTKTRLERLFVWISCAAF